MNNLLVLAAILCGVSVAYSQQDCFDKVAKQAVVIDSLEKTLQLQNDLIKDNLRIIEETGMTLNDTIKQLRSELSKLKKFKEEKNTVDAQFKKLRDSIALLSFQISDKNAQITDIKQKGDLKAIQEKEKGKLEALASILNTYKGTKFDDLIESSSKESVQRDKQLVGNTEVKMILDDLERYFNVEELFSRKFEFSLIQSAQNQANQISQQSQLVSELKDKIENLKIFHDGLKEVIEKINNLDKIESVQGMGEQIQKQKFNKIFSELTSYVFSYDFNFTDYPYLSDIFLEIIKRKQPNADSDISDLLDKF